MKNVTLSVEEDVLARVRRYAALRQSSVNALVREYLKTLAEKEDRAQGARKRIRELSRATRGKIGARAWSRDSLHER